MLGLVPKTKVSGRDDTMIPGPSKRPEIRCCAEGYCYAAGMAQLEDGAFYAAAPQEAEAAMSGSGSKEIGREIMIHMNHMTM